MERRGKHTFLGVACSTLRAAWQSISPLGPVLKTSADVDIFNTGFLTGYQFTPKLVLTICRYAVPARQYRGALRQGYTRLLYCPFIKNIPRALWF